MASRKKTEKTKARSRALSAIAHHEAAHAVMAIERRVAFTVATIVPGEGFLGKVHTPLTHAFFRATEYGELSNARVEDHVLVCYAGAEAERHFAGRYNHVGARQDRQNAIEILIRHVGSEEELNAWVNLLTIRARQFVRVTLWSEIEALAAALLQHKTLSAAACRTVLRQFHRTRLDGRVGSR